MSIIGWLRRMLGAKPKTNYGFKDSDVSTQSKPHILETNIESSTDLCSDKQPEDTSVHPHTQISPEKASVTSFDILINNFLEQFQFDPIIECPFIYHEGSLETFQCVLLVSKFALQHQQITNLFPDDNTTVYFTTLPRDNPALISFMDFALKKAMCIKSFSIYGSDGNAILNELYLRTARTSQRIPLSKEASLFKEKALQYTNESQLEKYVNQLYNFWGSTLYDTTRFHLGINKEFNLDVYGRVCEIMNLDPGASMRWKKEFNLYSLVKKHYNDTIYQFRAPWLGAQSLDIFIPSLNLGIEYQGVQHYKQVDLFGGEDGFHSRKANDEKKRRKCKENNVQLIEWPYTDTVSEGNLKIKFEDLGIVIPPAEKIKLPISENKSGSEQGQLNESIIRFLDQSLRKDNLAERLYRIQELIKSSNEEEIKRILCDIIINYSERTATDFFKVILGYDTPVIYQSICRDEKLLDFWASTGILNFYGRKVLFALENQNPGSDYASKYLKKMRTLQKESGVDPDTRFMNNLIKNEAKDNGISEERIKAILRKAY